ncbi:MAG: hypothetical protein ABW069_15540 [Duganella sp.]
MTFDDYINTGIHVGAGFRMTRVAIVGPYPTCEFIKQVLLHNPEEIILAVDDGWPQERLEEIAATCDDSKTRLTLRRVAPVAGAGLVHAKLYFIEWMNIASNYRRHVLLTGSANASVQGFGAHAESFSHIDLANIDSEDKKAAIAYFTALAQDKDVAETWFYVRDKSWVSMPALRIVRSNLPHGLDAWVRRGTLCHKYQPDPAFGRLILRLNTAMPQDQLNESLQRSGFNTLGETQTFTRAYVSFDSGNEGSTVQTWRSRYFTETDYGFWTSYECFKKAGDTFVASQAEGRGEALRLIRHASQALQNRWVQEFLESIRAVFDGVDDAEKRGKYFRVMADGELDEAHYRLQAHGKLNRDRAKAGDNFFKRRFTSGFAFPPVPPLGDASEEFVLTLCANLLAKARAQKTRNRLAARLRALGIADQASTPEELLAELRERWMDLRTDLINFFSADQDDPAWPDNRLPRFF